MRIARLSAILSLIALVGLLGASVAYADVLTLGGSYPSFNYSYKGNNHMPGGSGSIDPSFLNGVALPWVFCTQIDVNIVVGQNYNVAVNNTGAPLDPGIAAKIAYLLNNYAKPGLDAEHQTALQAAIWTQIYGSDFQILSGNSTNFTNYFNTYNSNVGVGNAAEFIWMSPTDGSQDLVTKVPEPSLLILLSLGLGAVGLLAKKFSY